MRPNAIDRRFVVVGLLACASCGGCGSDRSDVEQPLIVVVSGDTEGWIVPCGCTSNQSGGLLRRGTYVEQLRHGAEVVLVDAGGAIGGTSAYDRMKFEAILRGEAAMGVAAHNLGRAEALLGIEYLREAARRLGVPLISANLRDAGGELVGQPLLIVEAAGRRIAVVGVLDEQFATDRLQVAPPRQAVLEALAAAAGRYDSVLVLAYLPEDRLRHLAETLPEADLIVGGPTGQPMAPKPVGPALLASATHQGKFLARFDAPPGDGPTGDGSTGRWTGRIVELDEQFADHPRQAANLKKFYGELTRADFTPGQTSWAALSGENLPQGYRVAGTEKCRECHEDECRVWDDSRHAWAWKSLKQKGAHVDPDCQRCHVTGYGLPGGFESAQRSAGSVQVGCESCHGPSKAHADDEQLHTAHFARAKDHCTGCHDRENSPDFVYDEYWAKILHGESSAAEPAASTVCEKTSEDSR